MLMNIIFPIQPVQLLKVIEAPFLDFSHLLKILFLVENIFGFLSFYFNSS